MLQNRRHVDKRQEKEKKAYKCIVLCKSLHISSIIVVVVIIILFFDKNFREPNFGYSIQLRDHYYICDTSFRVKCLWWVPLYFIMMKYSLTYTSNDKSLHSWWHNANDITQEINGGRKMLRLAKQMIFTKDIQMVLMIHQHIWIRFQENKSFFWIIMLTKMTIWNECIWSLLP